ncbi:uncharacterized protein LOC124913682 [Impatiens glandulifera]|uniref:uncharacterized protein LOC124913682 n=1 Tax=Impatiens glandulifera TaxID=253017 RepID=UPI001FB08395|nr:uncharacterized protein LOC124913682 [Impatiens glandulifera]
MKKQNRQLKKKKEVSRTNKSADGMHGETINDEFIVENKTSKSTEKKRKDRKLKNKKKGDSRTNESAGGTDGETIVDEIIGEIEMDVENKTSKSNEKKRKGKKLKGDRVTKRSREDGSDGDENGKTKKPHNKCLPPREDEDKKVVEEEDVYQISSGDEDNSKGMKKWISEYHQSRPGLEELQQKIDDFITIHEEQEEKAKIEREAQAEEGGWTVVVHHKGRKKTTESDTGVTVGSVAEAVVIDNMTKKKKKEVELDFYRFQRREANRNEILSLQSKFEQDKKQIQQRRAERKFRPY